jgi:hypothetical protein
MQDAYGGGKERTEMFREFATAALVGVALLAPPGNAIAQRHGHGHGHHGHGHSGDHHQGHVHVGRLGLGYWPYYSSYSYSYPSWNYGWPYYGSYFSHPNAFLLGGGPIYLQNFVTYTPAATTSITLPNAVLNALNAAADANQPDPQMVARPAEIQFGGFAQFGELSTRLVGLANKLCLDLHHNYQHNAGFDDTYRAAYEIYETAKFVSANPGDRQEIVRRVNDADSLFHQVRADARRFRRRAVQRIAGTSLQTKLNEVEATLHDLMMDVGVMGTHGAPQPAAPPPAIPPQPANAQPGFPPPLPAPNPPGAN